MYTAASSGAISTQHFGEEFDADKVETGLFYLVRVYPPASVQNNPNITLHFNIEKISIRNIPSWRRDEYII